ncbi:hypothetical protein GCK72_021739 [Caenorhabditis remanei]|uniref:DUF7869 domain-containing protein n=1 Tax=Caenorhabditis remanei TaxID=31234 RepID=A0A6A5GIY7_CAERE|nr:hypothetical protein GCK72_021739 [Caenorhabditis remanei]KAF1755170.1 hypothetical protein GCK72_021739 [Caenorhabditis remanei]
MLPPNFSSRMPLSDSNAIPIGIIKKKMNLPIQKRKSDTLTRCIACCTLPELMVMLDSEEKRKEAGRMQKLHHLAVSQQRVVVDCLTRQSRDPDTDISAVLMDAMSNRCTKLPLLVNRPKSISDAERLAMTLSTVQLSEQQGENKFRNMEFPVLQGVFHHDSNYNLSILFDGISRLRSVGSTLFVIMDSSRNNKSFAFFGGIGFLLTKTKHLRQVTLVYPSVGHTHLSVDGHFGLVSKTISDKTVKDPEDKILYSSSLTMNSTQLVGADIGHEEYYSSSYYPTIIQPDSTEVGSKIQKLLKQSSIILSQENGTNFEHYSTNYGKKAINKLIMEINYVPPKVAGLLNIDQDPQMTVLRYLEQNGVNAGRTPQEPTVHASQIDQ